MVGQRDTLQLSTGDGVLCKICWLEANMLAAGSQEQCAARQAGRQGAGSEWHSPPRAQLFPTTAIATTFSLLHSEPPSSCCFLPCTLLTKQVIKYLPTSYLCGSSFTKLDLLQPKTTLSAYNSKPSPFSSFNIVYIIGRASSLLKMLMLRELIWCFRCEDG